jgi:cytochrome c-type biogenesis protein CcmH
MYTLRFKHLALLMSMLLISIVSTFAAAVEWQDVAANLMSPACPGRTLLNCTSGHAEQWRELIRQKIAQGETKEQIIAYFVKMRGEEILAAPPKRGFALTAWLFPALIIMNGVGVIFVLTRRWTKQRSASDSDVELSISPTSAARERPSPGPYRDRLHKELKDFSA